MNKPVHLVLSTAVLSAVIYYGCQKSIEDQPSTGTHFTIEAHHWRLSGYMFDTTKYGNWDSVDYAPEYSYTDYYCVPTPSEPPLNGEIFLSSYKCTVYKDNVFYIVPDSLCDWNRQPVLTDTSWYKNIANDIIFKPDGGFDLHVSAEQSKWIDESNSTCSNITYHPYEKSAYGYTGTWQLDSAVNVITLNYEQQYGIYDYTIGAFPDYGDTSVPRMEQWKVINLNDSTLSLNACLTCPLDSGYRQLYKAL